MMVLLLGEVTQSNPLLQTALVPCAAAPGMRDANDARRGTRRRDDIVGRRGWRYGDKGDDGGPPYRKSGILHR